MRLTNRPFLETQVNSVGDSDVETCVVSPLINHLTQLLELFVTLAQSRLVWVRDCSSR